MKSAMTQKQSFSAVKQWAMDPLRNEKMAAFVYVASLIEVLKDAWNPEETENFPGGKGVFHFQSGQAGTAGRRWQEKCIVTNSAVEYSLEKGKTLGGEQSEMLVKEIKDKEMELSSMQ